LRACKDPNSIDVKALAKEYSKSYQFWAGKKGAMMTSPKPYQVLLKEGFSPRGISSWVKRPVKRPTHPRTKGKTETSSPETPETLGEQGLREGGASGAESEALEHSTALKGMPTHSSTHITGIEGLPKGYEYSQLEAMTSEDLTSLGLTKIQGELYRYTKAENGDIVLKLIPKPEPRAHSCASEKPTHWCRSRDNVQGPVPGF
jgi:hypothetical protein